MTRRDLPFKFAVALFVVLQWADTQIHQAAAAAPPPDELFARVVARRQPVIADSLVFPEDHGVCQPLSNAGSPQFDVSECGSAPEPATCTVRCSKGFKGESAVFTCSHGVGEAGGLTTAWTGTPPRCEPDTAAATSLVEDGGLGICPPLSADGHPEYDVSECGSKPDSSTCTVRCAPGYTGEGAVFVCSHNVTESGEVRLTWTGASPRCELDYAASDACPPLSAPNSPQYDVSECGSAHEPETCKVTCAKGYTGEAAVFTCSYIVNEAGQVMHSWTGAPPLCLPEPATDGQCPALSAPGSPQYDMSNCGTASEAATCTVACAKGYKGGSAVFTCSHIAGAAGEVTHAWTGTPPQCEPDTAANGACPELSAVGHPQYDVSECGSTPDGAQCTVKCAEGYTGESAVFTCAHSVSEGGEVTLAWTGTPPQCEPDADAHGTCPKLSADGHPEYDVSECHSVTDGDSCTVKCAKGYKGEGSVFTCSHSVTENGETALVWTGVPPQCERGDAPDDIPSGNCALPKLDSESTFEFVCGKPSTAPLKPGESCRVQCKEGSVQTGGDRSPVVVCENGTLSAMPQVNCTPVASACTLPELPKYPTETDAVAAGNGTSKRKKRGEDGAAAAVDNIMASDWLSPVAAVNRGTCQFDYLAEGQTCTVKCSGELVDEATGMAETTYTCAAGGQPAQPSAVPVCVVPKTCEVELVENGSLNECAYEGGIPSGVTCELGCAPGYRLAEGSNTTIHCNNGVVEAPASYSCISRAMPVCPQGRFCASTHVCNIVTAADLTTPEGLEAFRNPDAGGLPAFAKGGLFALSLFTDGGIATVASLKANGWGSSDAIVPGAKEACGQIVPLVQSDSDDKEFYMISLALDKAGTKGVCAALRPCDAGGHEYLVGFAGAEAKFTVEGIEFTLRLNRIGFWKGGNNFTSASEVWSVLNENSLPAKIQAHRHIHVGAEAEVGLPEMKNVKATVKVAGTLDVDLDPAGNGFGGKDHAVLIEASASMELVVAKRLKFTFPGSANALLYWKYISSEEYVVNFMLRVDFTLGSLASSLQLNRHAADEEEDWVDFGKYLAILQLVDVKINARLDLSIVKQKEWAKPRWGIRLYGDITLQIVGEDVLSFGKGLMLEQLETGDVGLALVNKDGTTKSLPICFAHGMCKPGQACILGKCVTRPPCDCDYVSGGCSIAQNIHSNVACKCSHPFLWYCTGKEVSCSDTSSQYCTSTDPDVRTSRESCLFGKGNCNGYKNLGVGEKCAHNSQCQNSACGREAIGDTLTCCRSGQLTTFGFRDYCREMEDGSKCFTDKMCKTGSYCKGVWAPSGQPGVCTRKFSAGEPCSEDNQCYNNMCGRDTAAKGTPLTCCAPGRRIGTYAFKDYCYGMPGGSVCWSDAMCASHYCRGNKDGTRRGVCDAQRPAGAQCSKNYDCQNGACGRSSGDVKAPLVCCASGQLTTYGGKDYCTGMPNGSRCQSNYMCASGSCQSNTCVSIPDGSPCSRSDQCASGACGVLGPYGWHKIACCPSGKMVSFNGLNYCAELADTSACELGPACRSGACGLWSTQGFPAICCPGGNITYHADDKYNYCAGLPDLTKCWQSDVCRSGACGFPGTTDETPLCCPSGKLVNLGGLNYCTELPDDSPCKTDPMCASGFCDSGKCARKRTGAACTADVQCASGLCSNNVCKVEDGFVCSANSDCQSGACGLRGTTGESPICCPSGNVTLHTMNNQYYCAGLLNMAICDFSTICQSGACGFFGTTEKNPVCCPAGKLTSISGVGNFCVDLPRDAPCQNDVMCASGWCDGGKCSKKKTGASCSADQQCESSICDAKDQICKVPVNGQCDFSNTCENNACGYPGTTGSHAICCPSGTVTTIAGVGNFCTDLPDNSVCKNNDMCASGLCFSGMCMKKMEVNEQCDFSYTCLNNACGYMGTTAQPAVCCASGNITTISGVGNFCTELPDSSPCKNDIMCASGLCSSGTCKRKTGASCTSNAQCAGGLCASNVCKVSDGGACTANADCRSGECVSNVCKRAPGESCAYNADCSTSRCGYVAGTVYPMCCPYSQYTPITEGGTTRYYCTMMPDGWSCKINGVCASGLCSAGKCTTQA